MFSYQKISNCGSSNLIDARIFVGLSEILKKTTLDEKDKEEIKSYLYLLSKNINSAQKSAQSLIAEYHAMEKSTPVKGQLPSLLLLDEAELFLYYSKKALRNVSTIIGIIFSRHSIHEKKLLDPKIDHLIGDLEKVFLVHKIEPEVVSRIKKSHEKILKGKNIFEEYKDARFDKIFKDLKSISSDLAILKILEIYDKWLTKLVDLRNLDQHPLGSDALIVNYKVVIKENGFEILKPSFNDADKTPLYEFLQASSNYIFSFCEESILFSLIEFLPDMFEIIEIDEKKRDVSFPKRFKITLKGME